MTRETSYHGWQVPEEGDTNWDTAIDNAMDGIDDHVPLEPDTDPTPTAADRLLLNRFTNRDAPVLQHDTGSTLQQVQTAQRWDVWDVGWTTRAETVPAQWTFDQPIDADLEGRANSADTTDKADTAEDTDALDGHSPSSYAALTARRTVSASWTARSGVVAESTVNMTGGTLDLPTYESPARDDDDDDEDGDEQIRSPSDPRDETRVSTGDAYAITDSEVTLRGRVDTLGELSEVYAGFRIREDGSEYFDISGPMTTVSDSSVTVRQTYPTESGYGSNFLKPGGHYEYQFYATEERGVPGVGGDIRAFALNDV